MRGLNIIRSNETYRKLVREYGKLEARDRLSVQVLAGFFMVLFVVYGVWQPAADYAANAEISRDKNRDLLQYMNSTQAQARASVKTMVPGTQTGRSLITLVSATAQQVGIKPNKLQPEGTDEVSVWFESVPFNNLVTWLESLQRREGVYVRQISVDRQEQSGIVNARLVLTK
jgi:general secretion pathway protein M